MRDHVGRMENLINDLLSLRSIECVESTKAKKVQTDIVAKARQPRRPPSDWIKSSFETHMGRETDDTKYWHWN